MKKDCLLVNRHAKRFNQTNFMRNVIYKSAREVNCKKVKSFFPVKTKNGHAANFFEMNSFSFVSFDLFQPIRVLKFLSSVRSY